MITGIKIINFSDFMSYDCFVQLTVSISFLLVVVTVLDCHDYYVPKVYSSIVKGLPKRSQDSLIKVTAVAHVWVNRRVLFFQIAAKNGFVGSRSLCRIRIKVICFHILTKPLRIQMFTP